MVKPFSEMMHITHFIVIAGLSCSGKSTIIEKIINGNANYFINILEIADCKSYTVMYANQLGKHEIYEPKKIILHYDLTNHLCDNSLKFLSNLFARSNKSCVLTINAPREILIRRNFSRIISAVIILLHSPKSWRSSSKSIKYLFKSRKLYDNSDYINSSLLFWNKFLDKFNIKVRINLNHELPENQNVKVEFISTTK